MRAVMIETESRPVEDAAFGDGGMERGRGGLGGFLGIGKVAAPLSAAPTTKMIPVVGGNITPNPLTFGPPSVLVNGAPLEGHVFLTINGKTFESGSGLTPAKRGTTGWVLEQKLLQQMIVQGFLPATVKTIADLPVGSRMTKYDGDPGKDVVTYEVVIPGGGTFRAQFSQVALQMMKVGQ